MTRTTDNGDSLRGATLVIVDVQATFDDPVWGTRNNLDAEERIADLLRAWRAHGNPIVHVMHRSEAVGGRFADGGPGQQVKPEAAPVPGEEIFWKEVNSAFIGTRLEGRLRAAGSRDLVFAGLTTDHCISTSVRMAANLQFGVTLSSDATATFDRTGHDGRYWTAEQMHDSALASLHGEFAQVRTTAEIIRAQDA